MSWTFQLQISLLAKPHPAQLPNIFHHTELTTFLYVVQMLLKMKELAIWKLWGAEMMSHKPKAPLTLLTCCAKRSLCLNKTCQGEDLSKHRTTHLVAKMLPCVATSINPGPPSSLGMIQTSQGPMGRPLAPPCLAHKYDCNNYSNLRNWALLGSQHDT